MSSSAQGGDLACREFHRILLVKPSSLGDVVHALPVLHALRRRYPQARIDWLIGSAFLPLIEGNPDLTEAVPFDRKKFSRVGMSFGVTRDFASYVRDLRKRNYDLVIDLQGLFRSGFLSWVTAAPVRIGFAQARESAGLFYTHKIPPSLPDTHAVDRNMSVGRLLGFPTDVVEFSMGIDDALRAQTAGVLRQNGLDTSRPYIAVAPGARWDTKRWSAESFANAIRSILQPQGMACVLLGGAEDVSVCREIAQRSGQRAISLAGKTTIRQMIAVIDRAALILCLDSAPMHIAAALGAL